MGDEDGKPADNEAAPGVDEAAVDASRVAERAELRAVERRAGSDDPGAQAEAILADAEERRRTAAEERDPDAPVD